MKCSIISDQIHADLKTAFSLIRNEGYSLVELHNINDHSIETCSEDEIDTILALLKEFDLKVSALSSTVFFLCPLYKGDKVSLFNPAFHTVEGDLKTHLHILEHACRVAKRLDCSLIRLFPFRWPDNRQGPYGTPEDFDRIEQNIRKAVEIAQENDITLILENCPYSHLPKGRMTLEIIKRIDSPHLRLLWDPANSYRAIKDNVPEEFLNDSLIEELEAVYPYIEHIHLKNYRYEKGLVKPFVHTGLMQGDIDFAGLLEILRSKGYDKALSLEPEVDFEAAIQSMKDLKDFLNR